MGVLTPKRIDYARYGDLDVLFATPAAGGDTTAPVVNVTVGPSLSKISTVVGKNDSDFSIVADEDFVAYQVRAVPATSSTVAAGVLVESGGSGSAGVAKALDVTGAELSAAVGEGTHIIKAFTQDAAGNWST